MSWEGTPDIAKTGYAERFRQHFIDLLNSTSTPNQIKLRYANAYWAGALSSIIIDWVNHQQDLTLEELAQLGSQLMTQGIEVIKEVGNSCDWHQKLLARAY